VLKICTIHVDDSISTARSPPDADSCHHRSDRTGPDLPGAAELDMELIENRTLDGHIQELIYRPTLH
jgi:hypothetical protein